MEGGCGRGKVIARQLNVEILNLARSDQRVKKINKCVRKINGAKNSTSTTLILRGKVGTGFPRRAQTEIVSAPFLTVHSVVQIVMRL